MAHNWETHRARLLCYRFRDTPATQEGAILERRAPQLYDYARAAALLWGEAGEFAVAEFGRLNRAIFSGGLPPLPIVIGLTAYGRCLGATRAAPAGLTRPRVSLAPEIFRAGTLMVTDVLTHEMAHAALLLQGLSAAHNDGPWCELVTRLSPVVLGCAVAARPVRSRRIPNPARDSNPAAPKTIVVKRPHDGELARAELATWPQSLRPADYWRASRPIPVDTY